MVLPRLERLAELAGDSALAADAGARAELRESYRYFAALCLTLVGGLEPELADLPPPVPPGVPVEQRIAFQMGLIKRANRLCRAVAAHLETPAAARRDPAAR